MILDGWGKGDHGHDDVVYCARPEYIMGLEKKYPNAELRTDGENVGLPDGQMGNSEVGHLNIGAGRVVYQDLVKINIAFHGAVVGRRGAQLAGPPAQIVRYLQGVRCQ